VKNGAGIQLAQLIKKNCPSSGEFIRWHGLRMGHGRKQTGQKDKEESFADHRFPIQ
jgi:hypothetical protein